MSLRAATLIRSDVFVGIIQSINDWANRDYFGGQRGLLSRLAAPKILNLMWLHIFLVSLYDIWMVIAVDDIIFSSEQNPICLALIQFDPKYYSLFISMKILGTLIAISVCQQIVRYRRDVGTGVTSGVAGFQSGLLVYLTI